MDFHVTRSLIKIHDPIYSIVLLNEFRIFFHGVIHQYSQSHETEQYWLWSNANFDFGVVRKELESRGPRNLRQSSS